ncbi:MAG TPA: hypothetical protein VFQ53_01410 [Kofleriaceae bacterium]|nr:hypothetical protein [Kofleriaceae bacterium]
MGRNFGVRGLAVCLALALPGTLAACQPLYGGKPEKLKNPEKKKRPPEAAETVAEVKYVEDCAANFRDDPKRVFRDTNGSNTLVIAGDDSLIQADKAKEPQSQAELIRVSIDKYRNALTKDPYSAEATLKLAVAYDRVYRKGCALKLLARIATLEGNPKFAKEAKRAADLVADTKEWFRGYRKDAVAAVGR